MARLGYVIRVWSCRGGGALDHACEKGCSAIRGASQARTARIAGASMVAAGAARRRGIPYLRRRRECRRAGLAGADIGRRAGVLWGRELSLRFLAHAEWQLRRHKEAEAALAECLHIDRQLGDLWHMAWSTEALGWVAVDTGRFERGARLLGIAAGLWAQTGSRLAGPWPAWHAAAIEHLRERLGAARLTAAIQAGRALTRAQALAFALEEAGPVAPLQLSARELEVAALVTAGLGNRAIAERLFLSPRTVEKHVEHVMDKLALGSRAEIAAWYARQAPASGSGR